VPKRVRSLNGYSAKIKFIPQKYRGFRRSLFLKTGYVESDRYPRADRIATRPRAFLTEATRAKGIVSERACFGTFRKIPTSGKLLLRRKDGTGRARFKSPVFSSWRFGLALRQGRLRSIEAIRRDRIPVGVPALAGSGPAKAGTPTNASGLELCYPHLNEAHLTMACGREMQRDKAVARLTGRLGAPRSLVGPSGCDSRPARSDYMARRGSSVTAPAAAVLPERQSGVSDFRVARADERHGDVRSARRRVGDPHTISDQGVDPPPKNIDCHQ
jgi:hypothetical protein